MKTGYVVALVLLAFAVGALLTGATAMGAGMANWSPQEMWAACEGMMNSYDASS